MNENADILAKGRDCETGSRLNGVKLFCLAIQSANITEFIPLTGLIDNPNQKPKTTMPCRRSGGRNAFFLGILQYISSFLIFLSTPAAAAAIQDPVFSVSAECRENEKCVFEHSYIDVDIVLKNISDAEVGVPLEFLRQLGPYGVLIDNETKDEVSLHVGLPDLSLKHTFTPIPPGATVKVTQFLSASTITWARAAMVDLTALFAIRVPIKLKDREDPTPFSGGASVRIIGKDKLDNIRK